jgi:hypothetical protein
METRSRLVTFRYLQWVTSADSFRCMKYTYDARQRKSIPTCGSAATADTPRFRIEAPAVHHVAMAVVEIVMSLRSRQDNGFLSGFQY